MKLLGRQVGDVLTQIRGPQEGFNYKTGAVCEYIIFVYGGTGAVKLQECTTAIVTSDNPGDPNPIGLHDGPSTNPTDWSDVGAALDVGDGRTAITVTPNTSPRWLRVVITTAGNGKVIYGGNWGKL